jgi:hypothetical protein
MPVMLAVPGLLLGGVAFGYFIVLPAATHFLLNFNAGSFDVIVQASSYFPFAALILLAMGVIFQIPIALIALTRAEIVTTRQLRKNRRIAIAVAAVIAALLPGDAITMILETLPIIVLYEVSIHISAILDLRDRRRARSQASVVPSPAMASPSAPPHDHWPTTMLFDLRSRGRRRTIQVVYGFLAVLIGGGLVFFGVGGGAGSTGLLSQLANQGTGSSTGIKIDETA